jgi:hypothetical protein
MRGEGAVNLSPRNALEQAMARFRGQVLWQHWCKHPLFYGAPSMRRGETADCSVTHTGRVFPAAPRFGSSFPQLDAGLRFRTTSGVAALGTTEPSAAFARVAMSRKVLPNP